MFRKFATRTQAMNMRSHRWGCLSCHLLHTTKPVNGCVCGNNTAHYFPSKAEAYRWIDLLAMEKAGLISDLVVQPAYPIKVNGVHVCEYRADFYYFSKERKNPVIEDVKATHNKKGLDPVFLMKKKLVEAIYGFKIDIYVKSTRRRK